MCLLYWLLQGTLLILDEPTNHLDIPSKETLEEAVRQFEGAVIAVSHDRYFLKRIATRVLLVSITRGYIESRDRHKVEVCMRQRHSICCRLGHHT
jgi:ATPase subunit of ABC transporter with duplicated ATPase domains